MSAAVGAAECMWSAGRAGAAGTDREFFFDNLLVRNHYIFVIIRWTGLAPQEFEFRFPGSLTSTFLLAGTSGVRAAAGERPVQRLLSISRSEQ